MRRTLLLALIALALPGCSWLKAVLGGEFHAPTVQFQTLKVSGWNLTGVNLGLVFDVNNPNDVDLDLKDVGYTLLVEGQRVLAGAPPAGIKIPASSHQPLELPATVRFADVLPAAQAILHRSTLHWTADGQVTLGTPIGDRRVPLSAKGEIAVPPADQILRGSF